MSNKNQQYRARNNFLSNANPSRSSSKGNFLLPNAAQKFGGRAGGAGGRSSAVPPLFGLPPYIWMTAGGTTLALGYVYFSYLEEVPLTHRKRWIATSPQLEKQLGDQEYRNLLRQFQGKILPPSHPASRTVERVGSRIAASALQFAKEQNVQHMIRSRANSNQTQVPPFTYTVVRSEQANAFVLPGNHVFVMTGLFRYVRDEDELASVLGHETAHNVARHAGEKMSGSAVVNLLARLSLLFDPSGVTLTLMLPAAALFRELPHSRTQETEADQIGVHLAASACYDPRASKRVFAAMKQGADTGGKQQQPPEFLSTHPSHESRISNFDKWIPDAMRLFESDGGERCRRVRRDMALARQHAARGGGRSPPPTASNSTSGPDYGSPW